MDRREFIKNTCTACIGLGAAATALQSCTATKYISGKIEGDQLIVPLKEFIKGNSNKISYHAYIVLRPEILQYPICVYRFNETMYAALWMRCTHQGVELTAAGERLQCPAHGSEFDSSGKLKQGPADENLRAFPVTILKDELLIDLRKQ
jgi:Rieske Fe-S protein